MPHRPIPAIKKILKLKRSSSYAITNNALNMISTIGKLKKKPGTEFAKKLWGGQTLFQRFDDVTMFTQP